MEILNDKEAMNCVGGFKLAKSIIALITGVSAFVLGIIDGLTNPIPCKLR